jgi:tRNA pseudouridine38-40 synthase
METATLPRLALALEYDGAAHCGWQSQANGQAVQDALEKALHEFSGTPIATVAAGRTDAGVHALEQIVHVDPPIERELIAWVRGTNRFLPPTVRVLWARPMPTQFHARFSAIARRYVYVLQDSRTAPAIARHAVGWVHQVLDVQAMADAAQFFLGEHDFSSFRAAECQAKSPVKVVYAIRVERAEERIYVEVTANAFLHHMVRNMVGALVWIGQGKRPSEWIQDVLKERDRRRAAPTFAASGLHLCEIRYPAAFALPSAKRSPAGLPSLVTIPAADPHEATR